MKKTRVLLILDGYGLSDIEEGNAIKLANTPVMDRLMKDYAYAWGNASEMYVGLPAGQMGNSEVGHLNMGAGRIIYQELTRITKDIQEGTFFKNEALVAAVENCKKNNSSLHIMGLLSDGGVHSHNTHIYALLDLAKRNGIEKVYVHCFLDGRDTPPNSGKGFIKDLESEMAVIGAGKIASVSGRYYAMDRDNNYGRVQLAYNNLTNPVCTGVTSAVDGVQESYDKEVYDEFVVPFAVCENGKPIARIEDGDSVIFANFRPDRAREITHVFCDNEFTKFDRPHRINTCYVCFTDYDPLIPNKLVAFKKEEIKNTFGEWLSNQGMTQARLAETEKYAHVTFFFNGGKEQPYPNEDRILVNSPKVATYDLKPEMSLYEVCDNVCKAIRSGKYDVVITNFANPDMVGHTGVIPAVIKAIEAVDECVGKVVDAVLDIDGVLFICADHGNAEMLIDPTTHKPWTAHTTNHVPFILVNYDKNYTLREGGALCDIVPTIIETMGLKQPKEMTGKSLLVKKQ